LREVAVSVITCIDDMRTLARSRVPRMFFQYLEAGSWTEGTARANESDLREILLRQRVAVPIHDRSLRTHMLGQSVAMPVALAPTGLAGMQHANGEMLAARAAKAFGVPFVLSTMSICSMEDVAGAVGGHPFWFQLYVMKDRSFVESLIDRAKALGCSALMITLDAQIVGQRHQDIRNGLSAPPRLSVSNVANMVTRPRWAWGMLRTRRRSFGNIVGHAKGVHSIDGMAEWAARQYNADLNWGDIEWIKRRWGGKLILKGVMDAQDALLAVRSGADALVVSNHGGRQLDGAQSSIAALPRIVQAVGNAIEVHLDSGIRSGQDVLKARALGARGVYIGRAYLYGLGAMGQSGVMRVLEIIHRELDLTMAFCGHTQIDQVDQRVLVRPVM
jgi:L-lactate dehydrogenase (cytochrome)